MHPHHIYVCRWYASSSVVGSKRFCTRCKFCAHVHIRTSAQVHKWSYACEFSGPPRRARMPLFPLSRLALSVNRIKCKQASSSLHSARHSQREPRISPSYTLIVAAAGRGQAPHWQLAQPAPRDYGRKVVSWATGRRSGTREAVRGPGNKARGCEGDCARPRLIIPVLERPMANTSSLLGQVVVPSPVSFGGVRGKHILTTQACTRSSETPKKGPWIHGMEPFF
jgi:hypothetical protein